MTDAMNARYGQNDTSIEKITKTRRDLIYLTFQGMRCMNDFWNSNVPD